MEFELASVNTSQEPFEALDGSAECGVFAHPPFDDLRGVTLKFPPAESVESVVEIGIGGQSPRDGQADSSWTHG